MSFMGNLLAGSNQYQAPGANQGQLDTAYGQTQAGLAQQQALVQALAAQGGVGNQSNVFNQLQQVAQGQGPNPAQAMLANATGQNVAQQGALMAGQRGAGANVGLMARQAGQQGGALQQQAAGQGAALQAQQSLGALGQMGGIAGQQVGQQMQATQGYNQAAQGQQSNLMNMMSGQNQINSQIAAQNQKNKVAGIGGLLGGIAGGIMGPGASMFGGGDSGGGGGTGSTPPPMDLLKGGATMMAAHGGLIDQVGKENYSGPRSLVGRHLKGIPMLAKGGAVPAMVSPGEMYLPPAKAQAVAKGAASPMSGERIPGSAPIKGDNLANDTVSKTLQEGGVVIPRSVMQGKNPKEAAARFVAAHLGLAKKKKK